jgi:hypothetical protein
MAATDEAIGEAGLGHAAVDGDRLTAHDALISADDRIAGLGIEVVDDDARALASRASARSPARCRAPIRRPARPSLAAST